MRESFFSPAKLLKLHFDGLPHQTSKGGAQVRNTYSVISQQRDHTRTDHEEELTILDSIRRESRPGKEPEFP